MRRQALRGVFAVLTVMIMSACSTTALTSVWKDSAYQGGPLKKVLVIGVFTAPSVKRFFEDEFVRQLKARGVDAVQSYTVFPAEDDEILSKEMIVDKISELKTDSVLVTRVADVHDVGGYDTYPARVNPGGDFYDYYVTCCESNVTQGYVVMMETRIFEEKYDKLIWSAISESSLQYSREETMRSFITAAVRDLWHKNLLP